MKTSQRVEHLQTTKMQAIEPMTMGSPGSSPSAHNQSAYLPSYLLGHPASSMPASPNQRMWSGSSTSSSKTQWPRSANQSGTWSSPAPTVFSPANREIMSVRGKDKTGAPPVQGLLEHITSPFSTPDRHLDFLNQSSRANQFMHAPSTPQGPGVSFNQSSMADHSAIFGSARKSPPSPAQIDPFYTQGESIGPSDELDETWVTIFGFPAAAASFILQQFSQYGNILKHVIASEGNWLHIHYQSKLQAKKALSKNGKVFGSSIMVGVARCIDKNVMEKENMSPRMVGTPTYCSALSTPTRYTGLDTPTVGTGSAKHTPIRPLTAAYRAASSDQQVVTNNNTPQKSSNFLSKAVEYVFGW